MDERLRFVARLLEGEKMAVLCREFDISRKTGHKIFNRYKECGLEGLTDRSRRPYRQANRLPFQIEQLIVQLKKEHPTWGAPKIREKIRRRHSEISLPAISTVHAVLDRHGLVTPGRRPTLQSPRDPPLAPDTGRTIFGARTTRVSSCSPISATATRSRSPTSASRYCDAAKRSRPPSERYAFTVFERVFKDFGLPLAIRTDNGVPFASAGAFFGLTKLSVWWLRLGIGIERIKPGIREQNGRHERMHLTFKKEATKPAAKNFLQQQGKFDRLHPALQPRAAAPGARHEIPRRALCSSSPRPIPGLGDLHTPSTTAPSPSLAAGGFASVKRKINLSQVFAGQNVGVRGGQRENLARQLHAVRSRVLRSPERTGRMRRKPFRR